MKKLFITGLFVAVLIGGGLLIKSSGKDNMANMPASQSAATQAEPNTINIQNFSFKSDKLVIKKGTTITWVNQDDAHHDITPTSGASDFVASKLLAKDESYKFTFNTVGTYTYKCSPHPYMKGTIEVTE